MSEFVIGFLMGAVVVVLLVIVLVIVLALVADGDDLPRVDLSHWRQVRDENKHPD